MNRTVVIAGHDLMRLTVLAIEMGAAAGSPTLIDSKQPVEDLTRRPSLGAVAAVVYLTGTENIADLLGMFKANPGAAFVLLSPAYPPDAAVARVVSEQRGAILRCDEAPIVIAATLVALLARRDSLAV